MEPHWNPMVEAQAVDRVYRIGQTQEVTVIRYIVPTSVEIISVPFWLFSNYSVVNTHHRAQYVQQVQQEKLKIIHQATVNDISEVNLASERWEVKSNHDYCCKVYILTRS
jgi:hypothetical protein